jgi:hypothetical protein
LPPHYYYCGMTQISVKSMWQATDHLKKNRFVNFTSLFYGGEQACPGRRCLWFYFEEGKDKFITALKRTIRKFLNIVAAHTEELRHCPICLFETLFSCQCRFKGTFPWKTCVKKAYRRRRPQTWTAGLLKNFLIVSLKAVMHQPFASSRKTQHHPLPGPEKNGSGLSTGSGKLPRPEKNWVYAACHGDNFSPLPCHHNKQVTSEACSPTGKAGR